jgi:hypothetical protein
MLVLVHLSDLCILDVVQYDVGVCSIESGLETGDDIRLVEFFELMEMPLSNGGTYP